MKLRRITPWGWDKAIAVYATNSDGVIFDAHVTEEFDRNVNAKHLWMLRRALREHMADRRERDVAKECLRESGL